MDTPHMQWPFRLTTTGTGSQVIAMVEQDTTQEIAQCVAFLFSTEPGELVGTPDLGLEDPTFKIGGVTETELLTVTDQWEPRAVEEFTNDELRSRAQEVGVTVS